MKKLKYFKVGDSKVSKTPHINKVVHRLNEIIGDNITQATQHRFDVIANFGCASDINEIIECINNGGW